MPDRIDLEQDFLYKWAQADTWVKHVLIQIIVQKLETYDLVSLMRKMEGK